MVKRYSHQRRLKQQNLLRAEEKLVATIAEIERVTRFAPLFELVEKAVGHLDGLGELYVYDTALRIGFYRQILPERVYLHAGSREGARALNCPVDGVIGLFKSDLPDEFRKLEMYEIEDVLCIYKRYFTGEQTDLDDNKACWLDDISEMDNEIITAMLREG